ncbi:MAG: hypothetical protein EZS28_001056, partial [Streblomastix strix]
EEEKKRKEAETEKRRIEEENFEKKRENEKIKYQLALLKQKFGVQKIDEEIQLIEEKEKEISEENKILKEENQKLKDEILQLKDEKIHQLEEENKRKDQENKKLKEDILKLKDEVLKEKQKKEKQDQRVKEVEEQIQKLLEDKKEKEEQLKKLKETPVINLINPNPTDIEISDVAGGMKKIFKRNCTKADSISLTQVLESGVWSMEALLQNTQGGCGGIGIVKDSYNIPAGANPNTNPNFQNMAAYTGNLWGIGQVYCKEKTISGNSTFGDNQILKQEYDSEKGTLAFFLDGVQQPVYISGIKEKVRFIACLYYSESSCIIRSLKKLAAATAVHVANEKAVQW